MIQNQSFPSLINCVCSLYDQIFAGVNKIDLLPVFLDPTEVGYLRPDREPYLFLLSGFSVEIIDFSVEEHLAVPVVAPLLCTLCCPEVHQQIESLEKLLPFGFFKQSNAGNFGFQLPFFPFIHLSKTVYDSFKDKSEPLPDYVIHYPLNKENYELVSNKYFPKLELVCWNECPHFGPKIGETWESLEQQLSEFRETVVYPEIKHILERSFPDQPLNLYLAISIRHARFKDGTKIKEEFSVEEYSGRSEQVVLPMLPIVLNPSELSNYPIVTDHMMQIFQQIELLCRGKEVNIHTYIASNLIHLYSYMHAINYVFYKSEGFENWRIFDRVIDKKFRIEEKGDEVKGHQIYRHQLPFEIRAEMQEFVEQIEVENQISEEE